MPIVKSISRSCREYTDKHRDSRINCANCVKYDRELSHCADIAGVIQRYEDSPVYDTFSRMMQDSKSIVI